MQNDISTIISEMFNRIDKIELIRDYNPVDKGNYYLMTCPNCKDKSLYLYKSGYILHCNHRNKCNYEISLWKHIKETNKLETTYDVLKYLSKLSDYPLPENTHNVSNLNDLNSLANKYFKENIFSSKGKKAITYLTGIRKYTIEDIKNMELGFFHSREDLDDFLSKQGFNKNDVITLPINRKYENVITIPYKSANGLIKGFVTRVIEDGLDIKYLYPSGFKKNTFFNINKVKGYKDTIIIVEGIFDAIFSESRGIDNIVAIGGSFITNDLLNDAIRTGIKHFILALDNDEAGRTGTEKAIKTLQSKDFYVEVLDIIDYKDLDEFIRNEGAEKFNELMETKRSGVQWIVNRLLIKHDIHNEDEKRELLAELKEYDSLYLTNPIDRKELSNIISIILGVNEHELASYLNSYKEKELLKLLKHRYKEMLKSCEQLLKDGKIKEFEEELTDELYSLKAKSQVINMHTYTMEKLEEDIKSTKDGLITGFPSIDSFITIPQGAITVIAGRPSHGKTTLMMNLFINMLKTYYNKSFLFFSYEESKRQIGLKILTILSEEILDTDKNISHLNNYIKTNNYNNHSINKAKKLFKTFSDSGRMWIIDEPYYVDNLNEVLISLQQKLDIGAVFIDYIQKIKIKGKYYSRQVELQKVSERILETAIKMDIPIIMGAQFNRDVDCADKVKLGNLREAGDIEQDANLVIGIWNYSMENSENNGNNSNGKIESEIEISILKNRNGIANKKVKLILNKPILTIKELPTTKW